MTEPITIRRSTDEDRLAIVELAALDSRRAPQGEALLAFIGTELRAALPRDSGEAIADPFQHTAELVDLLRVRALSRRSGGTGRLADWRHCGRGPLDPTPRKRA
jgi:hypothetical protein